MKRIVEIRAAEGGEDSRLFAFDLGKAYQKFFTSVGWKFKTLDQRGVEITLEVEGKDLSCLDSEAGGHRIQRVPPTERKGRIQTSTVTVAIIESGTEENELRHYADSSFRIEWFSGTGAGGQHRNKHQNSCRVIHIETGLEQTAQTRSRASSLESAKTKLIGQLECKVRDELHTKVSGIRKHQVGSGERGDKIRTYRFQDNVVTDHCTGRTAPCDQVMKGKFNLLWNK